jgi:hypothetical protein
LELSGIEELYEERFRVDRRKLEHMILGRNSFSKMTTFNMLHSRCCVLLINQ